MAKKSRRARRQRKARATHIPSPPPSTPEPEATLTSDGDQASTATLTGGKQVDFSAEYRYVIHDLRSMAIIALAMLGVLIALSFVIR